MTYKIEKTDAEWKTLLADKGAEPLAFDVTRHESTERAYSGKWESNKAHGFTAAFAAASPCLTLQPNTSPAQVGRATFNPLKRRLLAPRSMACSG